MLVILSDLHLTDATTGPTLAAGAMSIFAQRLREMAVAAGWRADGAYRPIDRIDLVLLGDVLDCVRSSRWATRSNVRPWDNPHSPEFVEQIARITGDILEHNEQSLAVLRSLAGHGGVSVPAALRAGRPAMDGDLQPVPLRIHYMVGNHDWFFHLPGPNYAALRQSVTTQMALCHPAERPFPHDVYENEDLLAVMRRHKVTARHGDSFDPLSFTGDRDASSVADAVVIELLGRFLLELPTRLGQELPRALLTGLRELDNVRPLLMVPVWLEGLLERTCSLPVMRKRVRTIWDHLADELLSLEFLRQRDTLGSAEMIDGLAGALKFSHRLSTGWAGAINQWLARLRGARGPSYAEHALHEQDFRNRRSRHIVYGHTHLAETVPLDASYAEGYVLDQVYFNTGTWRRIHRPTCSAPHEHEFVTTNAMTYLAFFQGDERGGRPFETWTGTLAFSPSEGSTYRLDPARHEPARAPHSLGTPTTASGVPCRGPHFPSPQFHPSTANMPRL